MASRLDTADDDHGVARLWAEYKESGARELRDQLIRVPYVRAAMLQTYLAALGKTRVGN